jgi:galactokinase
MGSIAAALPATDDGLGSLVQAARRAFAARTGLEPRWTVAAPGRVNLIGEHTDYNGGFVLPMAIDRYLIMVAAPSRGSCVRVHTGTLDASADIPLDAPIIPGPPTWANYVRGVIAGFRRRGLMVPPLDITVRSDIPPGAGLSSSAALEVATATILEAATGVVLDGVYKANLCRQAEHDYAGVPCGPMDQLTCVLSDEAGPLLIDCEVEQVRAIRFPDSGVSVLVCDSNVRHALGDGEYARRRSECYEAARLLGVATLRASTSEDVEGAPGSVLGPLLRRRARHVVGENARTLAFALALERADFARAGALMYESHRSLRDDFEVSCAELDTLVDVARDVGEGGGVLGSRMTGGGFGGCTVTLVRTERVGAVADALARSYRRRHGRAMGHFVCRPARGAHLISASDAA